MKVQCGQCPAKYAVADERIRDKKVRIRCRRCNAAIVVDGKVSPPLVTSTPARRSVGPFASEPPAHRDAALLEQHPPESLPPPSNAELDSRPSPRPVAHTLMGGLEAPMARHLVTEHLVDSETKPLFRPARAPLVGTLTGTGPEPGLDPRPGMPERDRGLTDPPTRDDVERWRVALTQQDLRWMTTEEITQAFRDGAVKSETFVFRAGMPTWVTLLEVSEIAQALADAHLVSPPLQRLQFDQGEARPSDPPRRQSSLPPPRRAPRNRDAGNAAPDSPHPTGKRATDSEESLPFNLVSGRGNGSKLPTDTPDAEPTSSEPAAGAAPPGPATSEALTNGAADAPLPAAAGHAGPSGVTPVAPSPLQPAPAGSAAAAPRGGSSWVWVLLGLLLLAAAAFFFGPRFGLHLY